MTISVYSAEYQALVKKCLDNDEKKAKAEAAAKGTTEVRDLTVKKANLMTTVGVQMNLDNLAILQRQMMVLHAAQTQHSNVNAHLTACLAEIIKVIYTINRPL